MKIFQVRQRSTGAVLWVGQASDAGAALDVMARAAGYPDAAHLPAHVRNGGFRTSNLDR